MFCNEAVRALGQTGRITAAGSVRVYLGVETANNNGSSTIGVDGDFGKDFPSNPTSFTLGNQSCGNVSTSGYTWNLTTSGVGIYHAVTGSGNAYFYETLIVS
jgi:hypothetical protein